jgi:hypothetical protein
MIERVFVVFVFSCAVFVTLTIVHCLIVTPIWRERERRKARKVRHDALIKRLAETGQITK